MVNAGRSQVLRREEDSQEFLARYLEIHDAQARSARQDLDRLRGLIDDAAARLLSSFDTIGAYSRSRREAVPEEHDVIAQDIERAVNEVVSAMQFQDMATQLVDHAAQRIALLESISATLGRLPEVSVEELTAAVAATTCERRSPVEQACMTGGSVELF